MIAKSFLESKNLKKKNRKKIIFENTTLEESALKYCLSFSEISSVIVGMNTNLEIIKNCSVKFENSVKEIKWKSQLLNINE